MQLLAFVIVLAIALVQLVAMMEGMDVWLGFGPILSILGFFVLVWIPGGSIGIAILGYMGATMGWGWEWWQALLLVVPGIAFAGFSLFAGGVMALYDGVLRRR